MKKLRNKYTFLVLAVLSSVAALVYSSGRVSYYFIDKESFHGATVLLLVLLLISFAADMVGFCCFERLGKKTLRALAVAGAVFAVIGIAVSIVFLLMGWEMWADFWFYMKKTLPYFFLIWFALAALFIVPKLKRKAVLSVGLMAVLLVSLVLVGLRPFAFKFSALPNVFVRGQDEYSVVWATNRPSAGKLEVVKEGITYTFYDEAAGNMRTNDRVHHITVPYAVLNESDYYTVSSFEVKERTGYSLWKGKTIESERFCFQAPREQADSVSILSVSDWHEHAYLAQRAAANLPQAQVLIMGGDALNEVDDQAALIAHLLAPCAALSASCVPVIFARGNHECRGDYAVELQKDLGLESFYFAYRLGCIGGVVLDMGECYGDDFVEYLSLADYESYRDKQESWLKNVQLPETKYHISICHDELFEAGKEGRIERTGIVESLGAQQTHLLVSGHLHESIYRPAGENGRAFATFVDGGINSAQKSFGAGFIVLEGSSCSLSVVDSNGQTQLQESFEINL